MRKRELVRPLTEGLGVCPSHIHQIKIFRYRLSCHNRHSNILRHLPRCAHRKNPIRCLQALHLMLTAYNFRITDAWCWRITVIRNSMSSSFCLMSCFLVLTNSSLYRIVNNSCFMDKKFSFTNRLSHITGRYLYVTNKF